MSRPGETTTEEHQGDGVPFAGPDTGREGDAPARLAVFDFDGTSIEGNSPVLLVQHLMERGMLRKRVIFRILLWAAAYKLRLPQNESKVRSLVFTAFEGRSADEVDRFLADFYDERIALLFRPEADAAMRAHAAAGDTVVVISATFEPIILPVSYTHLDVYKRQDEVSSPPPCPFGRIRPKRALTASTDAAGGYQARQFERSGAFSCLSQAS